MATEAQVTANRSNAQKSTGPRTSEGKAIVARNAVKHGLLGEQIVVEGEDRLRFGYHRDEMMRSLIPVGEVEITLAERLVGLSWRLQRIERLQVQAFETLCAPAGEGPADEQADEKLALGRIVVQDFSGARVLDKLLMYERRIEHSLCRILGELRRERLYQNLEARTQDDGNKQVLLERLMGKLGSSSPSAVLRTEPGRAGWAEREGVSSLKRQASGDGVGDPGPLQVGVAAARGMGVPPMLHGRDAHATLAPEAPGSEPVIPELLRQTKPIGEGVSSLKCQVSREEGQSVDGLGLQTSHFELHTAAGLLRQTNPISREANEGQVFDSTGVSSDSTRDYLGQTKPIPAANEASEGVTAPSGAAQGSAVVTAGR